MSKAKALITSILCSLLVAGLFISGLLWWPTSNWPYERVYVLLKNNKSANTVCDVWTASGLGQRILLGKPDPVSGHLDRCEMMLYGHKVPSGEDKFMFYRRPENPFNLSQWKIEHSKEVSLNIFEGFCFEKDYVRTDIDNLPPYCRKLKEVESQEFTALGK